MRRCRLCAIALEHELRRVELQALAARMGALPRVPAASPENAPLNSNYEASLPTSRTGGWRQAAANLRDELPN